MTSPTLMFWRVCLVLSVFVQTTATELHSSVLQKSRKIGEDLILKCFFNVEGSPRVYWLKQTLGLELKIISAFHKYGPKDHFQDEFKSNSRFSLDTENGTNHLEISNVQMSDAAVYYCIGDHMNMLQILKVITVDVTGSGLNIPVEVQQSGSQTLQLGGNVTLNCTVKTRSCAEEHSVYWFKDSEESHPGLIYTHGGRNDQCEKKHHAETQTCVYNLPMRSLDGSHVGTYYCAVVSCGHILFGKGTKLDPEDQTDSSLVLVYLFGGALIFMTILVIVLAFFLYKIKNRNTLQSQEASSALSNEGHRDAENLFYAAININRPNTSRRQKNNTTKDECVYSSVKQ